MRVTKELREQSRAYYTMTDELQVQLQVLAERGNVKTSIKPTTPEGDITALAFIVMMEASKAAEDDLKSIMAKIKAINSQKRKMRDLITSSKSGNLDFEATFQLMSVGVDALIDQMKSDLDSMGDMSELSTLRLQMAMDRMSKFISTLSNLLKKMSDTTSQITQNLK